MLKVSIIGATGYTGIELLRFLIRHPQVEIKNLVSHSQAGRRITDIYPQFKGAGDFTLMDYDPEVISGSDLVFTALPHGISQQVVAEIYQLGIKVIDLSGDFRYRDISRYESWYELEHNYPELAREAVYGLVELKREEIKEAGLIANPGCYPTASLLGLIPLVKEEVVKRDSIIIDAKSGVSGAGKALKEPLLFNEVDESLKPYGVTSHRHTSEIEAVLEEFSPGGKEIKISFTPHLVPMKRGILATIYADLEVNISEEELINLYFKYYPAGGFVQVLPGKIPQTKYVVGTNYCHLGIKVDSRTNRVIIISAIDNLGKGAAGQAIQNMNVIFGLPEDTGLKATGIFP
ncbi:MAG: N-acetyl-gamma-glutamyl-phosphate reductase [Halanaerobiales bacterium]|nr:N-acetyl-gamma-glutamyl-phosphate reductase [Halanaerobiales bacterium]